ncbi:MAG TPA: hypothetical protein VJ742_12995 [Nitrososphaera sp.]|nr:hypothetical protein [Nitrososphaera sp.]
MKKYFPLWLIRRRSIQVIIAICGLVALFTGGPEWIPVGLAVGVAAVYLSYAQNLLVEETTYGPREERKKCATCNGSGWIKITKVEN